MTDANYSTFRLFKKNVNELKSMRPDLYVSPSQDSYSILGKETYKEDFISTYVNTFSRVWALNTSIILNTTSFFEGALENLLLRGVGDISNFKEPTKTILFEYQEEIIKISSIQSFDNHFKKVFRYNLNELVLDKNDYKFIENFYLIRHLLVHGSKVSTNYIRGEKGSTLIHDEVKYIKLMRSIKLRYSYAFDVHIEFYWLILCSQIIDDFSDTAFKILSEIVENLTRLEMIDPNIDLVDHVNWGK